MCTQSFGASQSDHVKAKCIKVAFSAWLLFRDAQAYDDDGNSSSQMLEPIDDPWNALFISLLA
jgi:hypothetical protein